MDGSELLNIAVTAIVAAFAKEIASLLRSLVKKALASRAATTKIKRTLTINKATVGLNLALLLYAVWQVQRFVSDPSPVTRLSVFNASYFLCLASISLIRIEITTTRYFDERKRSRLNERAEVEELKALQSELRAAAAALKQIRNQTGKNLLP